VKTKTTILLLAASLNFTLAQGPLDPPAGPPAEGMKSLQEIWNKLEEIADGSGAAEGIPISSVPYTINQPGSYYLTGNLTYTGNVGAITITSPSVTLDLKGYTISSTAESQGEGIRCQVPIDSNPSLESIIVQNGFITGNTIVEFDTPSTWTSTPGGFVNGIYTLHPARCPLVIKNIHVSGTRSAGFNIFAQALSSFTNCSARSCGGDGFFLNSRSLVENCLAEQNNGDGFESAGSTIKNCIARQNAIHGFDVDNSIIKGCLSTSNGSRGFFCQGTGVIANCVSYSNSAAASIIGWISDNNNL